MHMFWNKKAEALMSFTMIEGNTQYLDLLCLMPAYLTAFADFQWLT